MTFRWLLSRWRANATWRASASGWKSPVWASIHFGILAGLMMAAGFTWLMVSSVSSSRAAGNYVVARQWGSQGNGPGQFSGPESIVIAPNGRVYVADTKNYRIQVFGKDGTFITAWGEEGGNNGQFNLPYALALGPDNLLYVADTINNRVQVFTLEGDYIRQWGHEGTGLGQFRTPYGLTVGTDGTVYVSDSGNNRIQKFDSLGNSRGTVTGNFNEPTVLAIDRQGNLLVADSGNFRVQRFSFSGQLDLTFGSEGFGNGQFKIPRGISVDPNGLIYVADEYYTNSRVQVFSAQGVYLDRFGDDTTGPGMLSQPDGIFVDQNLEIYVADAHNNRIVVFAPAAGTATPARGTPTVTPGTPATGTPTFTPVPGTTNTPTRTATRVSGTPTPTPKGIYGRVTAFGAPADSVLLTLSRRDAAGIGDVALTFPDANGNYLFSDLPDLTGAALYFVQFDNMGKNGANPAYLRNWFGGIISNYVKGTSLYGGSFDLANIVLAAPGPHERVRLPYTFRWGTRDLPQDRFEFVLYDPSCPICDPLRSGNLGEQSSYTLQDLPEGFQYGREYLWFIIVRSDDPQDNYGESYEYRPVIFDTDATPSPTATATSIFAPTGTATATASATATLTPTDSPTPTATSTPKGGGRTLFMPWAARGIVPR
ncbi:MAG: NHL repeat-containing protein [Chloroflexi bacterium]|nr:NHL repeat-containing protein [Chloroflexota bacterium]